MLCEQVEAHQPLAAELLRTLVSIGREYPSEGAVREYLRACLLAFFDEDVPASIDDEPVESRLAAEVAPLVVRLRCTALANEAYRPAAEAMAEVAALLGHAVPTGSGTGFGG
jgi:hypothetical protein